MNLHTQMWLRHPTNSFYPFIMQNKTTESILYSTHKEFVIVLDMDKFNLQNMNFHMQIWLKTCYEPIFGFVYHQIYSTINLLVNA